MKKILGLALLLAALGPAPGIAEDAWYNGIYIGGSVGAGRIEADLAELGLLPPRREEPPDSGMFVQDPIESSKFKKSSLTGKLFAGWRFARYFGIEAGYVEFFDVTRQYCFTEAESSGECTEVRRPPAPPSAISSSAWTVELPTEGIFGYVVGFLPFSQDRFDLFLKVGAIRWETQAAAFEKIVGEAGSVPVKLPKVPPTNDPVFKKFDGTDLATGLGINLNHPSGVTIRTEFEYFDIGDLDQSYLLSFSAIYSF